MQEVWTFFRILDCDCDCDCDVFQFDLTELKIKYERSATSGINKKIFI